MRDRAGMVAEQWRRERPDIDPFPMVLVGRIVEAAHLIVRDRLTPFFAGHGLQYGEFDVLATLRRAGAPYRLTPTALADTAMISSGGMTGRLDRLEKAGLIERQPHPADRRGVMVCLTPAGLALMEKILEPHVANEKALLSPLEGEEQATLERLLAKLLAGWQTTEAT
ncbi:MarR family winged helix-turn-helix transcriptional regulator [Niveispirillum irakense]|uniref:MarR family winged helix-turn-helix transcriptional regulator n=1 Tax=Niveispirillum irakense TaxID=34011 RepID=UPI0004917CE7|nr:MarR family transcriptional regulator [Niveispirillum irakense]